MIKSNVKSKKMNDMMFWTSGKEIIVHSILAGTERVKQAGK